MAIGRWVWGAPQNSAKCPHGIQTQYAQKTQAQYLQEVQELLQPE